ncbi:hypothetical protein DPMN_070821 [Dreissena polymorpha]|uniref:Uncharacterized protein n=1 Tax=Dreissena polymorpha TaxID=45954 RepID=A0A9D4BP90_DREPO|nr:hypothetical protein DPMN_070821 [Dreissena polymorpha]
MLTIHLEETDCFTAWVSAKELGITLAPEEAETKCRNTIVLGQNYMGIRYGPRCLKPKF